MAVMRLRVRPPEGLLEPDALFNPLLQVGLDHGPSNGAGYLDLPAASRTAATITSRSPSETSGCTGSSSICGITRSATRHRRCFIPASAFCSYRGIG